MSFLSAVLTAIGLVLLIHAIYSAHEHANILPLLVSTAGPKPLPSDIIIETLLSTFVLTAAVVLAAPPLRPIRWAEWAGRIEREGWNPGLSDPSRGHAVYTGKGGSGNPYRALEQRKGFWNILSQRKEFANWIKSGS